jgi:hypothetical protein
VLRGATLGDLTQEVVTLMAMGAILLVLSALRFRKKIG